MPTILENITISVLKKLYPVDEALTQAKTAPVDPTGKAVMDGKVDAPIPNEDETSKKTTNALNKPEPGLEEQIEPVEELSNWKMRAYMNKAAKRQANLNHYSDVSPGNSAVERMKRNRSQGISRAMDLIYHHHRDHFEPDGDRVDEMNPAFTDAFKKKADADAKAKRELSKRTMKMLQKKSVKE